MVSNIFYFHPYLGKITILTNIFQRGRNHQLDEFFSPGGIFGSFQELLDLWALDLASAVDWSSGQVGIRGGSWGWGGSQWMDTWEKPW